MNNLQEGEFVIKINKTGDNSRTILTAKVELNILYTYQYEYIDEGGKVNNSFDYLNICTNDVGGGNHFVISTPSLLDMDDGDDQNKEGFPVCELDELTYITNDFKQRYERLKEKI